MEAQLILVWMVRSDGTWREVAVAAEHYGRVDEIARGRNGDRSVSLVEPDKMRATG